MDPLYTLLNLFALNINAIEVVKKQVSMGKVRKIATVNHPRMRLENIKKYFDFYAQELVSIRVPEILPS